MPQHDGNQEARPLLTSSGIAAIASSSLAGVFPARFGQLRPAAAATVDDGRGLADEVARLDAAGDEIGRHHRKQARLAVDDGAEHDHAGSDLIAQAVAHLAQTLLGIDVDPGRKHRVPSTATALSSRSPALAPAI